MYATISADIVSSTSLSGDSMKELNNGLKHCLEEISTHYQGFWGRIVRGDSIECALENPADALEVAILLKAWVKSFEPQDKKASKNFNKYGLRIAIGIGEMNTISKDNDMLDGEAIYRSGRALDKDLKGWSKYSFVISMSDAEREKSLNVIVSFINHLLHQASARQCQILYNRILSADSREAAEKLGITVSGINQTLKVIGWTSIEQAIEYYRSSM